MSEELYAIRRTDGELLGDYSFVVVEDATDWEAADLDGEYESQPIIYEMLKLTVEVVDTRQFPVCSQCGASGRLFWGLCETHAREDDPQTLEEALREFSDDAS